MHDETEMVVAEETGATILDATVECDRICVGATRSGPVSQAVSGSLPEPVGESVDGTVVTARGPVEPAMGNRDAIARRLEV